MAPIKRIPKNYETLAAELCQSKGGNYTFPPTCSGITVEGKLAALLKKAQK